MTNLLANHKYRVTIWEREDPDNRVVAWLGDTPPTPSQGGGGYKVVALPMRSAVTVWEGRDLPLLIDLHVLLWDEEPEPESKGKATRPRSTSWQANRLISMWRPTDDDQPPPVIKVRAVNNLIPYQRLPFVLNDFAWGAAIGNDQGERVAQMLTLQLMEYRADEELQTVAAHKPAATGRTRGYVVRTGDTLTSIARRYHLKNGWRELATAQHPPITDPRVIRVGQKLIIPAR